MVITVSFLQMPFLYEDDPPILDIELILGSRFCLMDLIVKFWPVDPFLSAVVLNW